MSENIEDILLTIFPKSPKNSSKSEPEFKCLHCINKVKSIPLILQEFTYFSLCV